jgi:hypothetical protein
LVRGYEPEQGGEEGRDRVHVSLPVRRACAFIASRSRSLKHDGDESSSDRFGHLCQRMCGRFDDEALFVTEDDPALAVA